MMFEKTDCVGSQGKNTEQTFDAPNRILQTLRASLVDDSVTTLLATNRLVRFHLHNLAAVYDSSGAESTTSTTILNSRTGLTRNYR